MFDMLNISEYIEKIMGGIYLNEPEISVIVKRIQEEQIDPLQFVAFLASMETRNRLNGIDAKEISYFAKALRKEKHKEYPFLCTAGTGGDLLKTINVSSTTAIVAASYGIPTLKHGSTGITKSYGSRDFFQELGIDTTLNLERVISNVEQTNFGYFDFSGLVPIKKRAGVRSPLHFIGPLAHPLRVSYKLFGCSNSRIYSKLPEILSELYPNYLITMNADMDELSIFGPTRIFEKKLTKTEEYMILPQRLGIINPSLEEIQRLPDPQESAGIMLRLFSGKDSTSRLELIALNSGAAFYLTNNVDSIEEGYLCAREHILQGKPYQYLRDNIGRLGDKDKFDQMEKAYVR